MLNFTFKMQYARIVWLKNDFYLLEKLSKLKSLTSNKIQTEATMICFHPVCMWSQITNRWSFFISYNFQIAKRNKVTFHLWVIIFPLYILTNNMTEKWLSFSFHSMSSALFIVKIKVTLWIKIFNLFFFPNLKKMFCQETGFGK